MNFGGGDMWYNITIANDTKYFENSDYYYSRLTAGVDFRAKNLELEKIYVIDTKDFENFCKKGVKFHDLCRKSVFYQK